jgi:hypothetical protein
MCVQWDRWLASILTEAEWAESGYVPTFDEYLDVGEISFGLEPIVQSTIFFVGQKLDESVVDSHDYRTIMGLVNRICRILNDIRTVDVCTDHSPSEVAPDLRLTYTYMVILWLTMLVFGAEGDEPREEVERARLHAREPGV